MSITYTDDFIVVKDAARPHGYRWTHLPCGMSSATWYGTEARAIAAGHAYHVCERGE